VLWHALALRRINPRVTSLFIASPQSYLLIQWNNRFSSFSGGLVFLETDDGLTIIAVTSYGTNYNFAGADNHNLIDLDYALELFE